MTDINKDNQLAEILSQIKELYNLDDVKIVSAISREPQIYKVADGQKSYFLKINRAINSKFMNLSLKYEAIEKFGSSQIIVPKIYRTKDKGSCYFAYGENMIELYEWLEFDQYPNNEKGFESTINMLVETGNVFSDMYISRSDERQIRDKIYKYICNRDFDNAQVYKKVQKYMGKYAELTDKAFKLLRIYSGRMVKELCKLPLSYIHADFNLKNIGYRNNKACVLMDFERVRPGFAVEDIALCMFELCIKDKSDAEIPKLIQRFMDLMKSSPGFPVDEKMLLFVICNRMLRHIYRGVENIERGLDTFGGFYDIFVEGLEKTYNYMISSGLFKGREAKEDVVITQQEYFELLLAISKNSLDENETELLGRCVKGKEEFTLLFRLACKHKIMSSLYFHLIKHNLLGDVSKYYKILMNNSMAHIKEKNAYFCEEFKKINMAFQKENINYACIKGISVYKRFYNYDKNILRDFNDMDFLIAPEDLSKAERVMREAGYLQGEYDYGDSHFIPASRQSIIYWRLSSHQIHPYVKQMPNFQFSPTNVFKADINFSIFFGGNKKDEISTEELLADRSFIHMKDGSSYPVLSGQCEVIQYCYNFYKDTIYKEKQNGLSFVLSNLRDISYIIEQSCVDTKKLLELLDNTEIKDSVLQVIEYVYHYYKGENAERILNEAGIGLNRRTSDELMELLLKI